MIASRLIAPVIGSLALANVLMTPRTTNATPYDEPPTATVRFAHLNLNSRSGAQMLYRRMQAATTRVCWQTEPYGTFRKTPAHESCLRTALTKAVHDVNSPALTAYCAERDNHADCGARLAKTASR